MAIEPRMLKGTLVVFETPAPVPTNLIVFQYNPEAMSRSLQAAGGGDGDGGLWDRLIGGDNDTAPEPPTQSFELEIELDATDGLERSDPGTSLVGLHAKIAQLELLMYPPSTVVILNEVLTAAGSPMTTPPESPKVLFVWGPGRVLPVRVGSLTIEEQAFDQMLNPIRASARLGLRTVTRGELEEWGPPFDAIGIAGHVAKEVLARAAAVGAAMDISIGGELSI